MKGNELDKALKSILNFSYFLNQYFQKQPWKNQKGSNTCIFVLVNATRSLAIMLNHLYLFSSEKNMESVGHD